MQIWNWISNFNLFLLIISSSRCQNHYKREFQMIGKSFSQLGQAMEGDGGNYNPGLNNAVIATGNYSNLTWLRLIILPWNAFEVSATRRSVDYTKSSRASTGSTSPTWCTTTRACWLGGLKSCTSTRWVFSLETLGYGLLFGLIVYFLISTSGKKK